MPEMSVTKPEPAPASWWQHYRLMIGWASGALLSALIIGVIFVWHRPILLDAARDNAGVIIGAVQFNADVKVVIAQTEITDKPLLNRPRDLAFDPSTNGGVLWVVNQGAPYRIVDGSYEPNEATSCKWRYGRRATPPENSRFWPSFTKINDPGTTIQKAQNSVDPWGIHFLAEASSIAFGSGHFSPRYHGPSEVTEDHGRLSFGTCGESRNEMKGCVDWKDGNWQTSTPLDFQGPTLWSTDPDVHANKNDVADKYLAASFCNGLPKKTKEEKEKWEECKKNYTKPECPKDNQHCTPGEPGKPFTLGSHLDMLHESPLCMGIAWGEQKNAYWVFDGCGGAQAQIDLGAQFVSGHGENFEPLAANLALDEDKPLSIRPCHENGDIVRYDFRVDHGAGFDDHCDGLIERYAIGQVKRVDGVPSHMLVWRDHLFIADSGNYRVARLDPKQAGDRGDYSEKPLSERVNKACTVVWEMENARKPIVSTYMDLPEATPSGIALYPRSALPRQPNDPSDGEVLIVSDNAQSKLLFITLTEHRDEPGELLGFVDLTGQIDPGGLMGLAVHPVTSDIYVADALGNKILRVNPIYS